MVSNTLFKPLFALQFLSLYTTFCAGAGRDDWRRRSVYQLMTDRFARTNDNDNTPCDVLKYCGGTWQGLTNHLDWIQDMGFTAVWISPIQKGVEGTTKYGDNFHGYWSTDLTTVNPHFGTVADLINLSAEVHKRGMYLMFDIAINGMGLVGGDTFNFQNIDYSHFVPFNKPEFFHPYCAMDFSSDVSCENCWFGDKYVSLADINTENPTVIQFFNTWIPEIIKNYTVDGLRLDALKHIPRAFWTNFGRAAKSFMMGENYQDNAGIACPYQQTVDSFFDYPLYSTLFQGFSHPTASLSAISNAYGTLFSGGCSDPSILGTFIENHDLTRFWNQTSDITLGKNAMTYLLLADGIPFFYSGFETGQAGAYPNYNRDPLWPAKWVKSDTYNFISLLNKIRNGVINKDGDTYLKAGMKFLFSGQNALAFKRGGLIVFMTNVGSSGGDMKIVTSDSGLVKGTEMVDFVAGGSVIVGDGGVITVTLAKGMPMVLYPKTELSKVVLSTKVNALSGSAVSTGSAAGSTGNSGSGSGGSASGAASGSSTATGTGSKSTSTAKSRAGRVGRENVLWHGILGLGVAFGVGFLVL